MVFYGHGVGNNKEQSFPVATELAGKGIATVSIDWVAQGERAVKVPVCGYQIVTLIRLSVQTVRLKGDVTTHFSQQPVDRT